MQFYLFSLVLSLLQDVYKPLELVCWICGIYHQPVVLPCTEVHIQGHHSQTRLHLGRVETSSARIEFPTLSKT